LVVPSMKNEVLHNNEQRVLRASLNNDQLAHNF
jgi:hypothetical protein